MPHFLHHAPSLCCRCFDFPLKAPLLEAGWNRAFFFLTRKRSSLP
jgi:hypothetical protein